MDIGAAQLTSLVTHYVGSKVRDEGVVLSGRDGPVNDDVASIILKNYLARTVRTGSPYSFFHESDVNLNEINVFAAEIFEDQNRFFENSIKIAKHLYSKSTHPNIMGGDLFVVLFERLLVDGAEKRALGIFKSETKERFLSVRNQAGTLTLQDSEGIDPRDLQKAAVIVEGNVQVFAVERGHTRTTYWIHDFLKLQPYATPKSTAAFMGQIVKKTIAQIDDPQEVEKYKSEFESLVRADQPTLNQLAGISQQFIGKEKLEEIYEKVSDRSGFVPPHEALLEPKQAVRAVKSAFRRITISSGVDLVLSGKSSTKNIRKEYSKNTGVITIYINARDN